MEALVAIINLEKQVIGGLTSFYYFERVLQCDATCNNKLLIDYDGKTAPVNVYIRTNVPFVRYMYEAWFSLEHRFPLLTMDACRSPCEMSLLSEPSFQFLIAR